MENIVILFVVTFIFGGAALIAAPLEWFFFRTKKGGKLLNGLYKAIKDGRI